MRSAASAMLDAERARDQIQRNMKSYPTRRLAAGHSLAPNIDAVEREDDYEISAELPGVEPTDLDVFLEDGVLRLSGSRKSSSWTEDLADDDKEKHVARFERRFRFNHAIVEDDVKARYRNGLLTITVPKASPPVPERTTIPVEVA